MSSKIIWLTGLSGSGKTTLSKKLGKKLLKKKIKFIDGDIFRKKKNDIKNKFTRKNIYNNNISIIKYIEQIKKNFDIIVVSVISPLLSTRKIAKKTFGKNYFEVYLKCSIKELVRRDTKGLYKMAEEKKIKNLIGFNSKVKYEASNYKKIVLDTEKNTINECLKKLLMKINL